MNLRQQLLHVADAYCEATGRARGTVSAIILNRGSKLDLVAKGEADVTTRMFERGMGWFSANWPDGLPWPESVSRPRADHPEGRSEIVGGGSLGHDGETAADGPSGHAISVDAALQAEAGR